MSIGSCPLPDDALLARYRETAYTDCFTTTIARPVTLEAFVIAFYGGAVFRLERFVLARFGYRSTDQGVRQLACGAADRFAAWRMEDRDPRQLLLCDVSGNTRSWLMVSPTAGETRLYFGSAVTRRSLAFRALLGFHRIYSRLLLAAARRRLVRG